MSTTEELILREISAKNAGWPEAVEIATIGTYAFRNTPRRTIDRPPMYRFDGDLLRPVFAITDPRRRLDALVSRAGAFRDLVNMQALATYKMITSPRARGWIAYDPKDNAPVGVCMWNLPEYAVMPETLGARILGWLRAIRIYLHRSYLLMTRPKNSVYCARMQDAYDAVIESFDEETSDEKEEAIVNATDLSDVIYPANFAYEMSLFCVSRPGLGIGRQLMEKTIGVIESSMQPAVIKGTTLPPQAVIVATPEGSRLYGHYGFKDMKEGFMETEEGNPYRFTYMRKTYSLSKN